MIESIKRILIEQSENLYNIANSQYINDLEEAVNCQVEALVSGNKILLAGNGGSAADAQHFAAELVGRFTKERRGLAAIALTTDSSIITSVANDYSYNLIFARQIDALAKEGDVFIGISTSGNSKNIIEAAKLARERNVKIIGLLGKKGGELVSLCDIVLIVPFETTARIQETHGISVHIMCQMIEEKLFQ